MLAPLPKDATVRPLAQRAQLEPTLSRVLQSAPNVNLDFTQMFLDSRVARWDRFRHFELWRPFSLLTCFALRGVKNIILILDNFAWILLPVHL